MSAHNDIPHDSTCPQIRLGIAGWTVRREHASRFSEAGSHLARYATQFNAVEINSCFYRPHRRATYERWAAAVPQAFLFAVKMPKQITHELRLTNATLPLHRFLEEAGALGTKLGPLLVQLPPSLAFDPAVAVAFLRLMRVRTPLPIAFAINGPIARADLPGLCDRVCASLTARGAEQDKLNGLETGADVNVIARLTDDCRQRVAKFPNKSQS